jgi:hypothetical protein
VCAGFQRLAGVAAALLLALVCGAQNARAATLTMSNVEDVQPGDTAVDLPMSLSNNGASASVGGVQADVSYDISVLALTTVKPGAAAQSAGKNVSFNEVSEGVVRVIVAGLNQKNIQDGVLAALMFNVAKGAQPGSYPVTVTAAELVTPNGVQVAGYTVPGSVTVVAAAAEGESGNEGEGEGEGEGETGTPSGCACGTLTPPHDPGNFDTGILLAACSVMICFGASRRERRRISR